MSLIASPLEIRPIRPDDAQLITRATEYTSLDTYYRRFHASKIRFSSSELNYLTQVDGHNHVALIAIEQATQRLAGVARFVRSGRNSSCAEMALIVHDPFQRRGLGRELMLQLTEAARRLEFTHFTALVQADNFKMKYLIRTLFPKAKILKVREATIDYLIPLDA